MDVVGLGQDARVRAEILTQGIGSCPDIIRRVASQMRAVRNAAHRRVACYSASAACHGAGCAHRISETVPTFLAPVLHRPEG